MPGASDFTATTVAWTVITTKTKLNGSNYTQWSNEMVLLLEQMQVYGIAASYEEEPATPAENATALERTTYEEWMKRDGAARSTILLGMEPHLQSQYLGVENASTLWKKIREDYKSKLSTFYIRKCLHNTKLEDCRSADSYVSKINQKVDDYNLHVDPDRAEMSIEEHVFYLLNGLPPNGDWEIFLEEIIRDYEALLLKPEEIIAKLFAQEATIKRKKGLSSDFVFFAKKQTKDKKKFKRDKDKTCYYCQGKGHIKQHCESRIRGGAPVPRPDTAVEETIYSLHARICR
ncbi:hypothetical protein K440DRAFT_639880 [Wilcoxina mikolae CBS 423.85]|nr:hypothetical protein K440DRAFT_639880 [Wilcoxina mikolae CBS 423.85]